MSTVMTMRLSGDEEQGPKKPVLKSAISLTQEAMPKIHQGRVEVYDFAPQVRIPTIQGTASYLLYQLMGHEGKEILMSPTGGIAKPEYAKPVAKLVRDKRWSGGYAGEEGTPEHSKYTNEDTERGWLVTVPEFIDELVANGWICFPKVEKVEDYYQKQMGLKHDDLFRRRMSLKGLIRAIQLSEGSENYRHFIEDLQETAPFGDAIDFVYTTSSFFGIDFFHMPVKHKDRGLELRLTELDCVKTPKDTKATMTRRAIFAVNLGESFGSRPPAWLTPEAVSRITILTNRYLEGKVTTQASYDLQEEDRKLRICIDDRKHGEEVQKPNTLLLLDKAVEVAQDIEAIVKEECTEFEDAQAAILKRRQKKLGIAPDKP